MVSCILRLYFVEIRLCLIFICFNFECLLGRAHIDFSKNTIDTWNNRKIVERTRSSNRGPGGRGWPPLKRKQCFNLRNRAERVVRREKLRKLRPQAPDHVWPPSLFLKKTQVRNESLIFRARKKSARSEKKRAQARGNPAHCIRYMLA